MKTLKRIRKFRIPNRLAIVGAILLATSTLAGVTQTSNQNPDSAMLASHSGESGSGSSVIMKKQRGFKVGLLLLRLR